MNAFFNPDSTFLQNAIMLLFAPFRFKVKSPVSGSKNAFSSVVVVTHISNHAQSILIIT